MAWGLGYPADGLRAPGTLVVVHLAAVGWLSLLMGGALLQFVPVLVNRPLAWAGLALPALLVIVSGLASLLAGFFALGGFVDTEAPFLPVAGVALSLGLSMAAVPIGVTLALSLIHI